MKILKMYFGELVNILGSKTSFGKPPYEEILKCVKMLISAVITESSTHGISLFQGK